MAAANAYALGRRHAILRSPQAKLTGLCCRSIAGAPRAAASTPSPSHRWQPAARQHDDARGAARGAAVRTGLQWPSDGSMAGDRVRIPGPTLNRHVGPRRVPLLRSEAREVWRAPADHPSSPLPQPASLPEQCLLARPDPLIDCRPSLPSLIATIPERGWAGILQPGANNFPTHRPFGVSNPLP